MRRILGLAVLALAASTAPGAQAQRGFPPGPYHDLCRDIRIDGDYLSAYCRGSRGSGQSTLNVRSCASPISVDAQGGLICNGPGVNRPLPPGGYPGPGPGPGGGYPGPGPGAGGGYPGHGPGPGPGGAGRWSATLYERAGYGGRYVQVYGDTPNLDGSGLNDRVGSIKFGRRSGPWQVCSDARFGGRCVTVDRDVRDTRRLGMGSAISSLRPLR